MYELIIIYNTVEIIVFQIYYMLEAAITCNIFYL